MQRVLLKQADGHPTVAFRPSKEASHTKMLPNGTLATLVARDGAFVKIATKHGFVGYVKARNAKLVQSPSVATQSVPQKKQQRQIRAQEAEQAPNTVCTFTVNRKEYTIDTSTDNVNSLTSVHDWIAVNVPEAAPRRSCGIGYCGACVCTLEMQDHTSGRTAVRSFNSCIRPVLSCNGLSIMTTAGIGTTENPHAIQKAIADEGGSQCGFCSAGMVMNLYGALTDAEMAGTVLGPGDLEKLIDSNVCRCTGYRPLLVAYKSFGEPRWVDNAARMHRNRVWKAKDLLPARRNRHVTVGHAATATTAAAAAATPLVAAGAPGMGPEWIDVTTEPDLQQTLRQLSERQPPPGDVFLMAGNTSSPIYSERQTDVVVHIGQVPELQAFTVTEEGVQIWGGVTLANAVKKLEETAQTRGAVQGQVLSRIAAHGKLSPGRNIRNTGTIGGNMMLAYEHQKDHPFPLDWPTCFQGAGARVSVYDAVAGRQSMYSLEELWALDSMRFKYIQYILVPYSKEGDIYRSYRTGQRGLYCEAYLSAAMYAHVENGVITPGSPRIVYQNVGNAPIRITAVENAMGGMRVNDEARFRALAGNLASLNPKTQQGSVWYGKSLAVGFFYKFFLSLQPNLPPHLESAAVPWLVKGPTSSHTHYNPVTSGVLGDPIPKIDALAQCTGEAKYIQNVSLPEGTLHGAVVFATAIGDFTVSVDGVQDAVPSFRGIVDARDAPSSFNNVRPDLVENPFVPPSTFPPLMAADGKTYYVGQAIAVAVAGSREAAAKAASLVKVSYTNTTPPVLKVEDGMTDPDRVREQPDGKLTQGDIDQGFNESDVVFTDEWGMKNQYHYHLELQSGLAIPNGDGTWLVRTSTQAPFTARQTTAATLGVSPDNVHVVNERVGGAFGAKLSQGIVPLQMALAAANKMSAPVRVVYDLETNMRTFGLRTPWKILMKVGVMRSGKINAVQVRAYGGAGSEFGFGSVMGSNLTTCMDNCYNVANWDVQTYAVKLDLPTNTFMRAPGWLQGIFTAERVITSTAQRLSMDAKAVREANFYRQGDVTPTGMPLTHWTIPSIWGQLQESSQYESRVQQVKDFNASNRWVKKGISIIPSRYPISYPPSSMSANAFDCNVAIQSDGDVHIMSGGTEMGQGCTTKVAQMVAHTLGAPMENMKIVDQDSKVIGNAFNSSGGSISTELTCRAAYNACLELNTRLQPIKESMPGASWSEIAQAASTQGVDLQYLGHSGGTPAPKDHDGHVYNTYGVACMEVTVDLLTGQSDFTRGDIVYDLGRSVNPLVDVGQIEGGFIQGVGYAVTEQVDYEADGTMRYFTYYPPAPTEIPSEFNTTLSIQNKEPATIGGGKAVAEPGVTCAYVAIEALENALAAAASDAGLPHRLTTQLPYSVELRQSAGCVSIPAMSFK